jgi:hypothetical protein
MFLPHNAQIFILMSDFFLSSSSNTCFYLGNVSFLFKFVVHTLCSVGGWALFPFYSNLLFTHFAVLADGVMALKKKRQLSKLCSPSRKYT